MNDKVNITAFGRLFHHLMTIVMVLLAVMFFWFSTIKPPRPTAATMGPTSLLTLGLILLSCAVFIFFYLENKLKLRTVTLRASRQEVFNALIEIIEKKKWIPAKDGYNVNDNYFEFTQLNWVGMNDEITVIVNDSDYRIHIRGRHFHSEKLMSNLEFLLRMGVENNKGELEASR